MSLLSVESELREKLVVREKQIQAMRLENEQLRSSLQTKAGNILSILLWCLSTVPHHRTRGGISGEQERDRIAPGESVIAECTADRERREEPTITRG